MRRKLVVGNWKMNIPTGAGEMVRALADAASGHDRAEIAICPPYLQIGSLTGRGLTIGAQDCHANTSGAHTGDISAEMLAASGASLVIVGHSERRAAYGETDEDVQGKAEAAHRAGLTSIICVGETAEERAAGNAGEVVSQQVSASVPPSATALNTVLAYEPVWAIGSGAAASLDEISEMHAVVRAVVSKELGQNTADDMRILYGGSMNGENAGGILALSDVDGGLIGGASLKSDDFLRIFEAALAD